MSAQLVLMFEKWSPDQHLRITRFTPVPKLKYENVAVHVCVCVCVCARFDVFLDDSLLLLLECSKSEKTFFGASRDEQQFVDLLILSFQYGRSDRKSPKRRA